MYCFEVLAELNLNAQELSNQASDFKTVFELGLNDKDGGVRVASLKAVTAFLAVIEEQEVVLKFISVLDIILMIVIEALKNDEDQGRVALESLGELTNAHAEVWKSPSKLIQVITQILSNTQLEDSTRSAASEVILALSSGMPAALRKTVETQSLLFPAFIGMLMEVEKDDAVWTETEQDADNIGKDPVSTAISSLTRLSEDLGGKTALACSQPIIQ